MGIYTKLASLCMDENYFTFRGIFYKATAEVSMANPMSPLVTKICMAYVQPVIEEKGIMLRIWFRYNGDAFAIVEKGTVDNTLAEINRIHPSMQFTYNGKGITRVATILGPTNNEQQCEARTRGI